ncbi:hypothetical protein IH992_31800 [Candidatus Poribacteria bacterium]|nr:hypothetical protein [Candidatus Poribacteria bacterium]
MPRLVRPPPWCATQGVTHPSHAILGRLGKRVACGASEGVASFDRLTVKRLTVKVGHFFAISLVPAPEPSQAHSRNKKS